MSQSENRKGASSISRPAGRGRPESSKMVRADRAGYRAHTMPLLLLVDDEIDLLRPLDFSLRREGFQTRLARSGAEALAAANEQPLPDLILLDLMLPDL